MRAVLLISVLSVFAACDNCPDGNASDSVYCHAASCAAEETVCAGACSNLMSDRDNCGTCGNQCGDGLVCSLGACVEGCDNGLAACGGACVDQATDTNNCGGCGVDDSSHVCTPDQMCNAGTCGCGPNDIVCNGTCTNPNTSQSFCGASGACDGANVGTECTDQEACVNGTCTSKLIYRGSLPATTGRWQFQATLGVDGANMDCDMHWPGTEVCTYEKLLSASMKTPAETINATDYNGVAVTSWWMHDPAGTGEGRCTSNADMEPWTYATQDQGHVGNSVTLADAATGEISALDTPTPGTPSCNQLRSVPCCSKVTAP
jgi:hypothetical protein